MKKRSFFSGILLISLLLVQACSGLEDFNNAENTYFMPDIDLFVIRSSAGVAGSERFNLHSSVTETAAEHLSTIFTSSDEGLLNYFVSQVETAFYHSKIRVFYIQVPATTDVDLGTLSSSSQFTLTDDAGSTDKGTVYNESGPLKIFFAGDEDPSAGYAGLGYVGGKGVLILSKTSGYSSTTLSEIVAHELGHNFGLPHPFGSDNGPNPSSCYGAAQGTTNRVMDYYNNKEVFAPCEQLISAIWVENQYGDQQTVYNPEKRGNNVETYIGDWTGTRTVGSAGKAPVIAEGLVIEVD
ncbi:MAG: hypothetical protein GY754_21200 [bacterium]|nr:hypothetical protein [bacterium]